MSLTIDPDLLKKFGYLFYNYIGGTNADNSFGGTDKADWIQGFGGQDTVHGFRGNGMHPPEGPPVCTALEARSFSIPPPMS